MNIRILATSLIYILLVILFSFALAFPGFGVLLFPQPFLDVWIGRWTMAYAINFKLIPWASYVIAIHLIYYHLADDNNKAALAGGVIFFTICILLTLFTSFVSVELRIRVPEYIESYTIPYLATAAFANASIEFLAYKLPSYFKKR